MRVQKWKNAKVSSNRPIREMLLEIRLIHLGSVSNWSLTQTFLIVKSWISPKIIYFSSRIIIFIVIEREELFKFLKILSYSMLHLEYNPINFIINYTIVEIFPSCVPVSKVDALEFIICCVKRILAFGGRRRNRKRKKEKDIRKGKKRKEI